ncbi:hypothetical protein Efla_006175 [Eimeria flavescens]
MLFRMLASFFLLLSATAPVQVIEAAVSGDAPDVHGVEVSPALLEPLKTESFLFNNRSPSALQSDGNGSARQLMAALAIGVSLLAVAYLLASCFQWMKVRSADSSPEGHLLARRLAEGGSPTTCGETDDEDDVARGPRRPRLQSDAVRSMAKKQLNVLSLIEDDDSALTDAERVDCAKAKEVLQALLLQLSEISASIYKQELDIERLETRAVELQRVAAASRFSGEDMLVQLNLAEMRGSLAELINQKIEIRGRLELLVYTPEQQIAALVLLANAHSTRALSPAGASAVAAAQRVLSAGGSPLPPSLSSVQLARVYQMSGDQINRLKELIGELESTDDATDDVVYGAWALGERTLHLMGLLTAAGLDEVRDALNPLVLRLQLLCKEHFERLDVEHPAGKLALPPALPVKTRRASTSSSSSTPSKQRPPSQQGSSEGSHSSLQLSGASGGEQEEDDLELSETPPPKPYRPVLPVSRPLPIPTTKPPMPVESSSIPSPEEEPIYEEMGSPVAPLPGLFSSRRKPPASETEVVRPKSLFAKTLFKRSLPSPPQGSSRGETSKGTAAEAEPEAVAGPSGAEEKASRGKGQPVGRSKSMKVVRVQESVIISGDTSRRTPTRQRRKSESEVREESPREEVTKTVAAGVGYLSFRAHKFLSILTHTCREVEDAAAGRGPFNVSQRVELLLRALQEYQEASNLVPHPSLSPQLKEAFSDLRRQLLLSLQLLQTSLMDSRNRDLMTQQQKAAFEEASLEISKAVVSLPAPTGPAVPPPTDSSSQSDAGSSPASAGSTPSDSSRGRFRLTRKFSKKKKELRLFFSPSGCPCLTAGEIDIPSTIVNTLSEDQLEEEAVTKLDIGSMCVRRVGEMAASGIFDLLL